MQKRKWHTGYLSLHFSVEKECRDKRDKKKRGGHKEVRKEESQMKYESGRRKTKGEVEKEVESTQGVNTDKKLRN